MNKKKSLLLSVISLVLGIIIGVVGTLGVMNYDNTGAIYEGAESDDEDDASSGTTYIDLIKLGGGYWDNVAKSVGGILNKADKKGRNYSRLGQDLNDGCGTTSDYIYMFESRTGNAGDGITDLIFGVGSEYNVKSIYVGNIEYKAVSGYRGDWTKSEYKVHKPYNFNQGAGGDEIYLFYTKDPKAGLCIPITKIYFVNKCTIPGDYYVFDVNCADVNLNRGAGGDKIYMKYSYDVE